MDRDVKDTRARIKLEDGTVIKCEAREIPRLVEYRRKARMDVSMYAETYLNLTGQPLPPPTTQ